MGDDTAGLMLTNPEYPWVSSIQILRPRSPDIVHEAGGACYYDGANLNAVMGLFRPGDTGFVLCAYQSAQNLLHASRRRQDRESVRSGCK